MTKAGFTLSAPRINLTISTVSSNPGPKQVQNRGFLSIFPALVLRAVLVSGLASPSQRWVPCGAPAQSEALTLSHKVKVL